MSAALPEKKKKKKKIGKQLPWRVKSTMMRPQWQNYEMYQKKIRVYDEVWLHKSNYKFEFFSYFKTQNDIILSFCSF